MIDGARHRLAPGVDAGLAERSPLAVNDFDGGKAEGREALRPIRRRLIELQELLWAESKHRLLVVFQAMDTGGKDGAIRRVFQGVNPHGIRVASFKRPTEAELAHDYLWRIHQQVPRNGEIVVFNRSHYEDVLIVRVHNLVPEGRWSRRYDHINDFERLLADEGTTILKFFLQISKEEQRRRLQARLDDPAKHWKFEMGDLAERELWGQYQHAFEEALSRTSTPHAPWYVVPADHKWYRDLVVASTIVQTLEGLGMQYPPNEDDLSNVVIK